MWPAWKTHCDCRERQEYQRDCCHDPNGCGVVDSYTSEVQYMGALSCDDLLVVELDRAVDELQRILTMRHNGVDVHLESAELHARVVDELLPIIRLVTVF